MALLAASSVEKRYGPRHALGPWSAQLEGRRVVWLAGGNGSGKTTLLRLAATSLTPSHGAIRIAGHHAQKNRDRARRLVALHWEGRRPYARLTPRENLQLLSRLAPPNARTPEELLRLADLTPRADEPVAHLSQGMHARLALASTLVHRPRLLLLDEPWDQLDRHHRGLVGELIADVVADGGSVVVTSHDPRPALTVADRVWALADGHIALDSADGPLPSEDQVAEVLARRLSPQDAPGAWTFAPRRPQPGRPPAPAQPLAPAEARSP